MPTIQKRITPPAAEAQGHELTIREVAQLEHALRHLLEIEGPLSFREDDGAAAGFLLLPGAVPKLAANEMAAVRCFAPQLQEDVTVQLYAHEGRLLAACSDAEGREVAIEVTDDSARAWTVGVDDTEEEQEVEIPLPSMAP